MRMGAGTGNGHGHRAGGHKGWQGRVLKAYRGTRCRGSAWLDALLRKQGRGGLRIGAGGRRAGRGGAGKRRGRSPGAAAGLVLGLGPAGATLEEVVGAGRRLEDGDERLSDSELSEATTLSTSEPATSPRGTEVVPAEAAGPGCSLWDRAAAQARALDPVGDAHRPAAEAASPARARRPGSILAVDCEMVGAGPRKNKSLLARCAIVDELGEVLMDEFVAPTERVTDYRTRWSGIRPRDLVGAPPFQEVRQRAASIIRGKLLIGHAIDNDLRALKLPHPPALTRDTSHYPGLRAELAAKNVGYDGSTAPSLKTLTQNLLGEKIQGGEHCPVEDARATMKLYVRHRAEWERSLL